MIFLGNEQIMWGLKYSDSLNWCMSKGHLLLAPSNYCLTHKDEGIVSWTNVFRLVKHYQVTKGISILFNTNSRNKV